MINNLEAGKVVELGELATPVTHEEILKELAHTRGALSRLQAKLQGIPDVEGHARV